MQVSVSYPVQRQIEPEKVAEIVAAVGRNAVKRGLLHKANDKGDLEVFALLKFAVTTKADARKVAAALKSFGEVRELL